MLRYFPPSNDTEESDLPWDQLTLGVNTLDSYIKIIEDFWSTVVPKLDKVRNFDIKGPEEEAWFHLRRTFHENQKPALQYASVRIEILRLKKGFITSQTQEQLRLLTGNYGDVICAGWWPLEFKGRHDNAFLSFLQKLSVLRGRDGIRYDAFLGAISDDYDKCPYCKEAYNVMMNPNSEWFEALTPWFDYMSTSRMDKNRTHEYAHWFGHIISGWP